MRQLISPAIIRLKDESSVPAIIPAGEEACLICGHCVAVCPHGALSRTRVPIEACPSVKKDLVLNENQAVQFLRSRSIRVFRDKAVEKETIQKLLEIARYAPTGSIASWWNGGLLRIKIKCMR